MRYHVAGIIVLSVAVMGTAVALAEEKAASAAGGLNAFENLGAAEVRFGPAVETAGVVSNGATGNLQRATIQVDASRVLGRISPLLYGMNMEDLNHEIYGGLYAQMLYGESFEEWPNLPPPSDWKVGGYYKPTWEGIVGFDHGTIMAQAIRELHLIWTGARFAQGEVTFEVLEPGCDVEGFIGVNFGLQRKGEEVRTVPRHQLRIDPAGSNVSLYKGNGYVPTDYLGGKAGLTPRMALDQWNRVRLVLGEKRVEVFINDAAVPQFTCDLKEPIPVGEFGFELHDSRCRFRNLVIKTGDKTYDLTKVDTRGRYGKISQWWEPIVTEKAEAAFTQDEENPYNTDRSQKIEFRAGQGQVGLINRGLCKWGLNLVKGMTYQGRIYLRGDYQGKVTVALQNSDGRRTYATRSFSLKDKQWGKYPFELKVKESDTNGRFAFWLDQPGAVWVDQAVLLPTGKGLYKGLPARRDYVETVVDMGTRLMRWGGDATNPAGWRWKRLVGDPDKRRQYRHPWYTFQSAGFAIEEFIQVCQAAGIEPIVELNAAESATSCAEFVAYCNAPVSDKWGVQRAANGHAEPYRLKYLKVGNGFAGTAQMNAIADAVHAVDPSVVLVGGALTHHYLYMPPESRMTELATTLAGKMGYVSVLPYCDQLGDARGLELLLEKLQAGLKPAAEKGHPIRLFSQEVNGGTLTLQRALSDMQYLNVCERYNDFVGMVTYCNLSASAGFLENGWNQARFYFDNRRCWLQPTGVAFQMASRAYQPCYLRSEVQAPLVRVREYAAERSQDKAVFDLPCLNVSATRSESGDTLVLKVVNIQAAPVTAQVRLAGMRKIQSRASVVGMSHTNLLASNPKCEAPMVTAVPSEFGQAGESFAYTFPGYSYTVLTLKGKAAAR